MQITLLEAIKYFVFSVLAVYFLLVIGGPIFDALLPNVSAYATDGGTGLTVSDFVNKFDFIIFVGVGLTMLAVGLLVLLMTVFKDESQQYYRRFE
tara:strand:- start:605 stop:889 length:285 start_codon:yes stop_codon:yes gene_type:complete